MVFFKSHPRHLMLCSADAMYMRVECKFVQSCVSTCGVFKLNTNVVSDFIH